MRDVDSVVFRPVAERRTRLWAWRVPGRETLGEAGTQSLATSQDHPPIPHLLWGCPAPPPGLFPQLGGSGGGDPPQPKPLRGHAPVPLLGFSGGQPPWLPGVGGWRGSGGQRSKSEGGVSLGAAQHSQPGLPPFAASPPSTSFSAEWVPPPQLPSLRAGRRHGVRTALSLGWGDGCCCEK